MSLLKQLKPIPQGLTPQEICHYAEIDWFVRKMPLAYQSYDGYHPMSDKFAVTNSKGQVLSICSDRWQPFQNLEIVQNAYDAFNELGLKFTHCGDFCDGKLIACVGEWQKRLQIVAGDEIMTKLILLGSHEVGIGHEIKIYFERVVCSNGLMRNIKTSRLIYGHTDDGVKALVHDLSRADKFINNYEEEAKMLANTPLIREEAIILLLNEFGLPNTPFEKQPRIVRKCLELFDGGAIGGDLLSSFNTAWGLLNCVTEYYSHPFHTNTNDRLKTYVRGTYGNRIMKLENTLIRHAKNYHECQEIETVPQMVAI